MNFEFTEEQLMIQQSAREFAEAEIAPTAVERDKNAEFPEEIVKQLGELGFLGMMVSPDYEGAGFDTVSYVLAMIEICKVDASVGVEGEQGVVVAVGVVDLFAALQDPHGGAHAVADASRGGGSAVGTSVAQSPSSAASCSQKVRASTSPTMVSTPPLAGQHSEWKRLTSASSMRSSADTLPSTQRP